MSRHLRIMSVLVSAAMLIMVYSRTSAKCVFSFDESPLDTSEVHLGYVAEDQVDYEVSIRDLLRRFDDSTYPKVDLNWKYRIRNSSSNIALNTSVFASSTADFHMSSYANDGDSYTFWSPSHDELDSWLTIDLEDVYTVNKLELNFSLEGTLEYEVFGSANESGWLPLVQWSKASNLDGTRSYLVDDIPVRYVKACFRTSAGTNLKLKELGVYGSRTRTEDRESIIIIVPHPDDEALIAAGVIKNAVKRGDDVKVVISTTGDFMASGHFKGQNRLMESVYALQSLGLSHENIIPLGYSDTGGFEPVTPYSRSFLYRLYHSSGNEVVIGSFSNDHTYGIPDFLEDYHYHRTGEHAFYTRDNFVSDLVSLISEYRPGRIFTTSLYDLHGDHAVLNLFVTEAVLKIIKEDPSYSPLMYEAIVHGSNADFEWPLQDKDMDVISVFTCPPSLDTAHFLWEDRVSISVPGDMKTVPRDQNAKAIVLKKYSSQYNSYIASFVKKDEIFWISDFSNKAFRASLSASGTVSDVDKVADGIVYSGGRLEKSEWMASGQDDIWIMLTWDEPVQASKVVLYDRTDPFENVLSGKLTFSDGSSIDVSGLPVGGSPLAISFEAKEVTWIKFEVKTFSGKEPGLAEIEVF